MQGFGRREKGEKKGKSEKGKGRREKRKVRREKSTNKGL